MNNMSKMKLGDIGKISMCKRVLKSQTSLNGEIPFFKISTFGGIADCFISRELYEEYKTKYSFPKKGSILISASGTLGRTVIYNGEEAFFQDSNIVWVDNDESVVLNDFLYYYYQLKPWKKTTGSTIERLYNNNLRDIDIIFPTQISEQKKIVDILKAIDKKIDNNNKINIELEKIANTIYDYWFLQYEFPNEQGKPYKSSDGKMVFNEELQKEIPEEWEIKYLKDFISTDKGGDWGKEIKDRKYNQQVVCLRGADFPAICGNEKLKAPKRYILEKNMYKALEKGDLIIEISGGSPTQSTGRICYINNNTLNRFNTPVITSNFCKAISLKDKDDLYWFYIQWCKLYENNVFFKYEGKTTGIKNLLFNMLCDNYKIVAPNKNIIKKYTNKVSIFFDQIQKNKEQNEKLIILRDFLIPLLMNGEIGFKS